jgi:translation elongation factor EF-G
MVVMSQQAVMRLRDTFGHERLEEKKYAAGQIAMLAGLRRSGRTIATG